MNLLPDWRPLRAIGQNRAVKSSYLWFVSVPVAARFLGQLDDPLVISLGQQVHSIELDLPFSWILFYFAAVAFALGTLLFSSFCPPLIRDFKNFRDYYMASLGAIPLVKALDEIKSSANVDFTKDNSLKDLFIRAIAPVGGAETNVDEIEFSPDSEEFFDEVANSLMYFKREDYGDIFLLICEILSQNRPVIRALVTFFYAVGFSLFGIVLIQNFIFVIKSV